MEVFNLLKLPIVAQREVIKTMGHAEIIILALTSDRLKSILKSCGLHTNDQIYVNFCNYMDINCRIGQQDFNFKIDDPPTIKLMYGHVYIYRKTFDEELIWKSMNIMLNVYRNPKIMFRFNDVITDTFAVKLIRLVKEKGAVLTKVNYDLQITSPEAYIQIIEETGQEINAPFPRDLTIRTQLPKGFQYSLPPSLHFDTLKIKGSCNWMKLEEFMMACRSLTTNEYHGGNIIPHLSRKYLNWFLKKIRDSKECRLEEITVHAWCEKPNFLVTVEGLGEIIDGEKVEFQRGDGRMVTVHWSPWRTTVKTI